MNDKEYIFKQAKRIYDDCVTSQENKNMPHDADGISTAYNDLLPRAQNEFPDNDVIQSLNEIHPESMGHGVGIGKGKSIQEIKSNTSRLADALDIKISDLKNDETRSQLRPFTLNVDQSVDQSQQQNQRQSQQQYVDIDLILEDVDRAMMAPDDKEELKEIVQEFEQELETDRDLSRLKELLNQARDRTEEYSVDVVAKLGMLGLQHGIKDLLIS